MEYKSERLVSLVLPLLFFLCVLVGCSQERDEYFQGKLRARQDIVKGILMIAIADREQDFRIAEFPEILRLRYGIGTIANSYPKSLTAEKAWVRGYNEETVPRIQLKFGTNVLQLAMDEARNRYVAKMAE